MVDIEGLSEAQVRYILKELLEMEGNSDYPQNNEESEMIKKIKIVNKGTSSLDNTVLRDTTIGNEYSVTFTAQGTTCPDGIIAEQDSLSFKDDVGDWVSIFVADETYEEVEEDSVPTINDILQEAQQAILQHHNISGKVTFTVTTE